jgi:hypothetical protein
VKLDGTEVCGPLRAVCSHCTRSLGPAQGGAQEIVSPVIARVYAAPCIDSALSDLGPLDLQGLLRPPPVIPYILGACKRQTDLVQWAHYGTDSYHYRF